MAGENTLSINLSKTAAILGIAAPVVIVIGGWVTFGSRVSRAEEIAIRAELKADKADERGQRIDVRLERIEVTLELIRADIAERVRSGPR